jgi:hypothetical protein
MPPRFRHSRRSRLRRQPLLKRRTASGQEFSPDWYGSLQAVRAWTASTRSRSSEPLIEYCDLSLSRLSVPDYVVGSARTGVQELTTTECFSSYRASCSNSAPAPDRVTLRLAPAPGRCALWRQFEAAGATLLSSIALNFSWSSGTCLAACRRARIANSLPMP